MTDPDFTPPQHLSWDDAVDQYENNPPFLDDAINALAQDADYPLPDDLADALKAWYRDNPRYERAVQQIIDEAAKP